MTRGHDSLDPIDALAQLAFMIMEALERSAAEHDLSIIQSRLLGVLRDREPTMNQLSNLLGLDKSSTTGLVNRAERRGLVARRPSTTDGRVMHVVTTSKGRKIATAVERAFDADVTAMIESLTQADRARLGRMASAVVISVAGSRGIDLFENVTREARWSSVAR